MARQRRFQCQEPSGGNPPGSTDLRSQGRYDERFAVRDRTWVIGPDLSTLVRTAICPSRKIRCSDHRRLGNGTVPVILSGSGIAPRNTTNRTTEEDQLKQSLPQAEPESQDQPVPFRQLCRQSSHSFQIV